MEDRHLRRLQTHLNHLCVSVEVETITDLTREETGSQTDQKKKKEIVGI